VEPNIAPSSGNALSQEPLPQVITSAMLFSFLVMPDVSVGYQKKLFWTMFQKSEFECNRGAI